MSLKLFVFRKDVVLICDKTRSIFYIVPDWMHFINDMFWATDGVYEAYIFIVGVQLRF